MLSNCLKSLENWLFQTQCLLCQEKVKCGKNICAACINELPWNDTACQKCAIPLHQLEKEEIRCGKCLHHPPPFNKAYAAFVYQTPIVQMIGQLKFNQHLIFGSVLSELLTTFLLKNYESDPWPEAIIPVPLHPKRLSERGYNQAIELARPIGKFLDIPIRSDLCERIKQTTTQSTVSEKERRINLRNAFAIESHHHLKHIAIIDDVLTTGSTVMSLSKALQKSGVEKIDIWAIAKTQYVYT